MNVGFSRAAMAAILAISLTGAAFSQDDFLRGAVSPETHAAPRVPMPDLIVTAGDVFETADGDRVIVGRGWRGFSWESATQNKLDPTVPSPPVRTASRTALQFQKGGAWLMPNGASLAVLPPLAAGDARVRNGTFRQDFSDWEFGSYRTRICADWFENVTERNEGNNCGALERIHLVPRRLSGRINGSSRTIGVAVVVTWIADITYRIGTINDHNPDSIIINYIFAEDVSLRFRLQGTEAGCTWSGTGVYRPLIQGIRLRFGVPDGYRAENLINPSFHFPGTVTCPPAPPVTVPFHPGITKWLDTGGFKDFRDPFALRGDFTETVDSLLITYSWNLEAQE